MMVDLPAPVGPRTNPCDPASGLCLATVLRHGEMAVPIHPGRCGRRAAATLPNAASPTIAPAVDSDEHHWLGRLRQLRGELLAAALLGHHEQGAWKKAFPSWNRKTTLKTSVQVKLSVRLR